MNSPLCVPFSMSRQSAAINLAVEIFKPKLIAAAVAERCQQLMPGIGMKDWQPDSAARHGHVELVRQLRARGVHCTTEGARLAVQQGQVGVVRDLHDNGIECTQREANLAAECGHLEVTQFLRSQGIHCTYEGKYAADTRWHRHVAHDLRRRAFLTIEPQYLVQPSDVTTASELPRLCVVLDVDATLLSMEFLQTARTHTNHTRELVSAGLEYQFSRDDDFVCEFIRPGVRTFLQELATFADIVLFTIRTKDFADSARELLDPNNEIIQGVFCRNHAVSFGNSHIPLAKDLYLVRPSLSRIVLVDDSWDRCARLQFTNCLPVAEWESTTFRTADTMARAKADNELMEKTLPMLRKLANVPDVRPVLAAHFASDKELSLQLPQIWAAYTVFTSEQDRSQHIKAREQMLRKHARGLTCDAVAHIVERTAEYVDYCIAMVSDVASEKTV